MQVPQSFILEAKNVGKSIKTPDKNIDILTNVNLSVKAGQSIAIRGTSGSGKTTLLGLLAGLDQPSHGEIYLFDHPLHQLSEDARAALRKQFVGFIFQDFNLISSLTALENVLLPLELKHSDSALETAKECLNAVGLSQRFGHYPAELSGGEQQRVAVARAFATEPTLLFADEPTGNLDKMTGQQIIELLFGLNQTFKTTLILVTHDDLLAHHCEQHYELDDGVLKKS